MKKNLIFFATSFILLWFNWLLVGFAWNNFFDILFTIFTYTYLLLVILIIIAGLLLIIQITKNLKGSDGIYEVKSLIGVVLGIILVITVIFINFQKFNIIENKVLNVSGFGPIITKNKINNDYYFYMKNIQENIRFKTDKKNYIKIIADENVIYTYEYITDFFDDSQGIIKSFDYDNYIDNRQRIID